MTPDDPRHPSHDPRYAALTPSELPLTESLKDTVARFLPYWHETIAPAIRPGKRVLIAAHGNSLRALVKYLDNIPEAEIVELNIPTGIPLVYELDERPAADPALLPGRSGGGGGRRGERSRNPNQRIGLTRSSRRTRKKQKGRRALKRPALLAAV